MRVEDLTLDVVARRAWRAGRAISLSTTEFTLLSCLMRNAGQVLTRSALVTHVWDYDFGGNENNLEVYISYLRAKIDRGHAQPLIHTVRGVGYRMGSS